MQRSPRVRIAPRFYDVQIAAQRGSHDASAWATHPRPSPTISVVSAGLGLGNQFARMALWSTHFWLVRAMRANLRVVEVELQISASHLRRS